MPKNKRVDNSTFTQKVALRRKALALIDAPVIMESHGGKGAIYDALYAGIDGGVVFEKDPEKADILAAQRPTWAVYEADCVNALAGGVGAHRTINYLDLDPYGECWPTMAAYFGSDRPFPERMIVVVNDGLRQKLRVNGAWLTGSMRPMVELYGNGLHDIYLEICGEMVEELSGKAGYFLDQFEGYYCGDSKQLTHFLAVLQQN